MKRLITTVIISVISVLTFISSAQNFKAYEQFCQSIRSQDDVYYFGSGIGSTKDIAKNMALQELSENIFIVIGGTTETDVKNKVKDQDATTEVTTKAKIYSYSRAYVEGLSKKYIEKDGEYHWFVYVEKSEIDEQNKERIATIIQYMVSAVNDEQNGNVGMALRTAYQAHSLLNCLSSRPEEVYIKNQNGEDKPATIFIPEFIQSILNNIKAKITGRVPNGLPGQYLIEFTYKGKPVSNIKCKYYDSEFTDKTLEATTCNEAVIDGLAGYIENKVELAIVYKDESKYADGGDVYDFSNEEYANKIMVDFPKEVKNSQPKSEDVSIKSETEKDSLLTVSQANMEEYDNVIETVVDYIKNSRNYRDKTSKYNHYKKIRDKFSESGFSEFMKLIGYGTPTLMQNDLKLTYLNVNGEIYCRSVRMNFKFRNNESFTEDIVFKFNAEGKISGLSMALGETAVQRSIDGGGVRWSGIENEKQVLINFLEDYRTAYALKDTAYLKSIFSPNALIIIGKKIQVYKGSDGVCLPEYRVETQRMTTKEYLARLDRIFANPYNFINIRFSDYVVRRAEGIDNAEKEIYAVQIKQDYFSSIYDDTGYLFLYVDLTDPSKPVVHIRAWQEDIDPTWKLMDEREVVKMNE